MKNKTKKRHIITGFDANYLHKAIVFYDSLIKTHGNFLLYVFCFDDTTYETLKKLALKKVRLYHTSDFENKELKKVRKSKKRLYEYYWTLNPAMLIKIMSEESVDLVALADCDMMFFQSPEQIYQELGDDDILIQPNNFSLQQVNDFVPVGYYCTSFQVFRNNIKTKQIVNDWYKECIKWCFSTFEEGRFGDQKYLESWHKKNSSIREVINPGANVAPWNIQKFHVSKINNQLMLNNKFLLIYYHYHSFKVNLDNYKYIITGDRNNEYEVSKNAVKLIYAPYISQIKKVIKKLKKIDIYSAYVPNNPEGNYHKQS